MTDTIEWRFTLSKLLFFSFSVQLAHISRILPMNALNFTTFTTLLNIRKKYMKIQLLLFKIITRLMSFSDVLGKHSLRIIKPKWKQKFSISALSLLDLPEKHVCPKASRNLTDSTHPDVASTRLWTINLENFLPNKDNASIGERTVVKKH